MRIPGRKSHGDLMLNIATLTERIVAPPFVIVICFHNVVIISFVFLEKWEVEAHFYLNIYANKSFIYG
jgi:hypothetical protein